MRSSESRVCFVSKIGVYECPVPTTRSGCARRTIVAISASSAGRTICAGANRMLPDQFENVALMT
jgi:hypothetical protein